MTRYWTAVGCVTGIAVMLAIFVRPGPDHLRRGDNDFQMTYVSERYAAAVPGAAVLAVGAVAVCGGLALVGRVAVWPGPGATVASEEAIANAKSMIMPNLHGLLAGLPYANLWEIGAGLGAAAAVVSIVYRADCW